MIKYVSREIVVEEAVVSILTTKKRKIKVVYGVEYSDLLGYRAVRRIVGVPGGSQLSPKWRKSFKAAENDLKSWREK